MTEGYDDELERLEKVIPTEKMVKYGPRTGKMTEAYKRRLVLIKKVGEMKSGHRKIIFGDCTDEPV